jgi:hypothetical protein
MPNYELYKANGIDDFAESCRIYTLNVIGIIQAAA